MAVDEALLRSAAAGQTTLRFYEWDAPTLSLGYFQSYGDRQQHLASRQCACVRRSSGGGAILHDAELTYSFTAPADGSTAGRWESLYDLFHESLIRALAQWGLQANRSPGVDWQGAAPPFLCFQRRARGDVVIGRHKICGSAQRRHRAALLQHGSVILQRSSYAPEIDGLEQISGQPLSSRQLAEAWRGEIGAAAAAGWTIDELSPAERAQAEEIRRERFANSAWQNRR